MILARLADTFALMYKTGIPIIEGLEHCKKVTGNLVIQAALARSGVNCHWHIDFRQFRRGATVSDFGDPHAAGGRV